MSRGIKVYPYHSKPFGLTFTEWSARWWRWLLMIPKRCNPTNDPFGQYASIDQFDPNVFFLCQTVESSVVRPKRSVSVPKGKSIFMPVLNWISNSHKHGKSAQELIEIARRKIDAVGYLQVKMNGLDFKGIEKYRFVSELFTLELPEGNILDLPRGPADFISDGYWLFTGPIQDKTVISTYGSCSSGVTEIGVEYILTVY